MITLDINPTVNNLRAYFEHIEKEDKNFLCVCFDLNTEDIRKALIEQGITKTLNLHESLDYVIEVDSTKDFNSPNKQTYTFSSSQDKQYGPITQSCKIPFYNRNLFEDLFFYIRVKVSPETFKVVFISKEGQTFMEDVQFVSSVEEVDLPILVSSDTQLLAATDISLLTGEKQIVSSSFSGFSNTKNFVVNQDLTKVLADQMYEIIADENSYNKELYSGTVYRWLIPFAKELNFSKHYLDLIKNQYFIEKIAPKDLESFFGVLYGLPYFNSVSYESYRNILINFYKSIQNTTWDNLVNTLKYLVGYKVDYQKGVDFYAWALKTRELSKEDATNQDVENPSYNNILSNYFVFEDTIPDSKKCANQAILLDEDFLDSTMFFVVDNFFNRSIDEESFKLIVKKLQPANFYSSFSFTEKI